VSQRDPEPPPDDATAATGPGELVLAEEGGVRVFYIAAPTMQELVDRLALVLGEHMHDGDELHVTYNAMQSGAITRPDSSCLGRQRRSASPRTPSQPFPPLRAERRTRRGA
jgi:hypothetical protein